MTKTEAQPAPHGDDVVLAVSHLSKTFRIGVRRKLVRAVVDATFEVLRGEVFGFLGPNGAGKTTTIKVAMGLIRPTSGSVQIFGQPHDALEVRRRVGYLPEHPYFYDYLKPVEILDFYGRLFGLDRGERRKRIGALLERVGLVGAENRTLRKFSKGMLQRIGIAQALVNDPDFVVLDEPLSGLDPVGRKQIRDLLGELRAEGKTLFFSTHILSDIELLCDKVAIINRGRIHSVGRLDELLHPDHLRTEVTFRGRSPELLRALTPMVAELRHVGDYTVAVVEGRADDVLRVLLEADACVESVVPRRESLEDLFVRAALSEPGEATA